MVINHLINFRFPQLISPYLMFLGDSREAADDRLEQAGCSREGGTMGMGNPLITWGAHPAHPS